MRLHHEEGRPRWARLPHAATWGLNLPFLNLARQRQGGRHAARAFPLAGAPAAALEGLARAHGTTLLATLLATLALVLHRYTNDDEIAVVAEAGAGQPPRIARIDLSGGLTCRQLFARARQAIAEADANGRADAKPLPIACFLRVGHETENTAPATPETLGLGIIVRLGERASCTLFYDPDALEEWFIDQFFRHLITALIAITRDAEQPIATLPILTPREQSLLTGDWAGERKAYPLHNKLQRLFEEQAERTPSAIAITHYDDNGATTSLTYAELNMRANEGARELMRLGIGREIAVGVYMPRSPQAVVALLAILKAGGVYVPLDTSYPEEYLRIIIGETQAAALLTTVEWRERASIFGAHAICIEELERRVTPASRENPSNAATTDDLAVIMYTSGSTGRPKGVRHRQRQLVNRFYWMWECYPFIDGDVICQRSPLGVMPSMWELMGGLLQGRRTAIVADGIVKDPQRFLRVLAEAEVSFITLVPSLLRLMLAYREEATALRERLRVMIIGGEPLTVELYERFRAAFPATLLINDYGCTEVNTILHYALSGASQEISELPGSRPVTNLQVYLLDRNRQLAPPGACGELYVGGAAISTGYLGQPELTAERFIANPFGDAADRLYRTGDLAYYLPDGTIKLLGRADDQAKINGMRVELSGIEALLAQHNAVKECAVALRTLRSGAQQLEAFVVGRNGAAPDELELRRFLEARLPLFMLPARYSFLEALPRTPSRKIDRRALQQPQPEPVSAAPPRIDRSEQELRRELRDTLAELLELAPDAVDIDRELYLLGVDSVLAVEFVRTLSAAYAINLSVTALYDHPTLRALAAAMLSQSPANAPAAPPADENDAARADDIAIIGVAGRFPWAPDLASFWRNLAGGVEAVTEAPAERWNADAYYDPDLHRRTTAVSKWGAFLDDIDKFEPLFFSIAPAEARLMDPQHRLCLEESWRALEDAGYAPDALGELAVGVFVGAKQGDYAERFAHTAVDLRSAMLGNDLSMLAARLSYHMNLKGPCLTLDTACSSSLAAIHLACQSIRLGESDMALAGGVCVVTAPGFYVSTSKLGVLSPQGHCRAFDNSADGFVQGEGAAFVVLKALRQALQDGDTIYGVVRATAMNHDGKTNGISAPSPQTQTALQAGLYQRSGIDPRRISYVEAHGTGTKLGDPIEIKALTDAFRRFTADRQFCAIGTLKPNIGHLTAAAGAAGLVKILLCFKHRQLPPSINYATPNEHIDFAGSPFYVNTSLSDWDAPAGVARLAAINSFGMGGTNVHCVLEEPPPRAPTAPPLRPYYLVPFSARTIESLRRKLADMRRWIAAEGRNHSIRDVSYTLLVGRKHLPIRRVYIAADLDDLDRQIAASPASEEFNNAGDNAPDRDPLLEELARYLAAAIGAAELNAAEYRARLRALAELFTKGFRFDGAALFQGERAYRIPLPTYPFLRERHWVEAAHEQRAAGSAPERTAPPIVNTEAHEKHETPLVEHNEARGHSARQTELAAFLQETLGRLLGVETTALTPQAQLDTYGFDSLTALTLKHEIGLHFGWNIPIELLAQGATIDEIARAIQPADEQGGEQLPASLKSRFLAGAIDPLQLDAREMDELFYLLAEDETYADVVARI